MSPVYRVLYEQALTSRWNPVTANTIHQYRVTREYMQIWLNCKLNSVFFQTFAVDLAIDTSNFATKIDHFAGNAQNMKTSHITTPDHVFYRLIPAWCRQEQYFTRFYPFINPSHLTRANQTTAIYHRAQQTRHHDAYHDNYFTGGINSNQHEGGWWNTSAIASNTWKLLNDTCCSAQLSQHRHASCWTRNMRARTRAIMETANTMPYPFNSWLLIETDRVRSRKNIYKHMFSRKSAENTAVTGVFCSMKQCRFTHRPLQAWRLLK